MAGVGPRQKLRASSKPGRWGQLGPGERIPDSAEISRLMLGHLRALARHGEIRVAHGGLSAKARDQRVSWRCSQSSETWMTRSRAATSERSVRSSRSSLAGAWLITIAARPWSTATAWTCGTAASSSAVAARMCCGCATGCRSSRRSEQQRAAWCGLELHHQVGEMSPNIGTFAPAIEPRGVPSMPSKDEGEPCL